MATNQFTLVPDDDPKWELVRTLLSKRVPRARIVQGLRKETGWSAVTAYDFINATLRKMRLERENYAPYDKINAIESIIDSIAGAKADKLWGTAIQADRLLAQIQGTLEPIKLEVHEVRKQALVDYLDSRDPDEVNERLRQIGLICRKAKLFDQGLSCRDVDVRELEAEVQKVVEMPELPPVKKLKPKR
jgi:hypothetical protein